MTTVIDTPNLVVSVRDDIAQTMSFEVCPSCRGTGKKYHCVYHGREWSVYLGHFCADCDGYGYNERPALAERNSA